MLHCLCAKHRATSVALVFAVLISRDTSCERKAMLNKTCPMHNIQKVKIKCWKILLQNT